MGRKHGIACVALAGIVAMIGAGSCGENEPTSEVTDAELVLRYFDVKDLLPPIDTLTGNPPILLPQPVPPLAGGSREGPAALTEESLIAYIRERTGNRTTWLDEAYGEGSGLEIRNRIVIARSTPAVLDLVAKVLVEIRASGDPLAHVEAHR
jgi:hypothetical protein